mmetsp:Transcript_8312/g.14348  ORF Transcript_8312/g.14348 Transcript_8312/m.14348 type:complete len:191 (-) Transcript_8312:321-893(-)
MTDMDDDDNVSVTVANELVTNLSHATFQRRFARFHLPRRTNQQQQQQQQSYSQSLQINTSKRKHIPDSEDSQYQLVQRLKQCKFPSSRLNIIVKTLTGKEIEIGASANDTINELKALIEEREGIPPEQQRLVFGGKVMSDERLLNDYVSGGDDTCAVLHLVLALRGGANVFQHEHTRQAGAPAHTRRHEL